MPEPSAPRRFVAAVALLAVTFAVLAPAPPAAAQSDEAVLRRALDLERRLLRQQLTDYSGARQQEITAEARLDQVAVEISQQAQRPSPSATALTRLRVELDEAVAAAAASAEKSRRLRESIDSRVQALALMSSLLAAARPEAVADVLTGSWRVTIAPHDLGGTFELRQDGTAVAGDFRLDDGRGGSLRGSFIDNRLLLERVDSQRGFDAIFEGYVSARDGRMAGFWQPTDLATGGSGGGGWAAIKLAGENGEGEGP